MPRLFVVPVLFLLAVLASAAQAEVKLVTSIKPLQLIAAAVQDGAGQPRALLPPGASPHHYALRPSDVRLVREADLFYWIGPDLEGFLARVLEGREGPSVAVQQLPGLTLRHFDDGHAEAHAEHEHEHEEHAPVGEHDHAHRPGSLDAHLWLLPANARVIARQMAADLTRVDAARAERYRANLQAFEARLDALDAELKQRLTAVSDRPFFVFHETYDYFEQAYGLEHRGVFSLGEVQPGARQVAGMRERLQAAGPSCVFSEPPLRPRLAETLTRGLPVRLAELDALGVGVETDARGYERLLDNLAAQLAGCLESL
ncbi:zinc ABC transporter substrate-binding protein [Stutzerimonas azotifigens]|uniref:zinc ABC transporter substrate-binding protein n=1 Tax=Stutzerimonas azotifigens TaxID=291995 RepID=UPI00040C4D8C|nr:zinc ABC transporter substrate-binding protein [Stutzerimonas azotifigens]